MLNFDLLNSNLKFCAIGPFSDSYLEREIKNMLESYRQEFFRGFH